MLKQIRHMSNFAGMMLNKFFLFTNLNFPGKCAFFFTAIGYIEKASLLKFPHNLEYFPQNQHFFPTKLLAEFNIFLCTLSDGMILESGNSRL